MMWKPILVMSGVAVLAIAAAPMTDGSELQAQIMCEFRCNDIEEGTGGWGHAFRESSGAFYLCGGVESGTCHMETLPGTCFNSSHEACSPQTEEELLALSAEVSSILGWASGGISGEDRAYIRAMAGAGVVRVSYNANRRAVQMFACDGRVVAHMPIQGAAAGEL